MTALGDGPTCTLCGARLPASGTDRARRRHLRDGECYTRRDENVREAVYRARGLVPIPGLFLDSSLDSPVNRVPAVRTHCLQGPKDYTLWGPLWLLALIESTRYRKDIGTVSGYTYERLSVVGDLVHRVVPTRIADCLAIYNLGGAEAVATWVAHLP